jgi:hypothetical protein
MVNVGYIIYRNPYIGFFPTQKAFLTKNEKKKRNFPQHFLAKKMFPIEKCCFQFLKKIFFRSYIDPIGILCLPFSIYDLYRSYIGSIQETFLYRIYIGTSCLWKVALIINKDKTPEHMCWIDKTRHNVGRHILHSAPSWQTVCHITRDAPSCLLSEVNEALAYPKFVGHNSVIQ